MTGEDPRGRLLNAAATDDPISALNSLRWALAWASGALAASDAQHSEPQADETWPTPESTAALEQVVLLDEALGSIGELAGQVRAVLGRARIGPSLQRHVEDRLAELSHSRSALSQARGEWAKVADTEAQILGISRERADLEHRIAGLLVLEGQNAMVPQLREQAERLSRRETQMRADLDAADGALVQTAERVVSISQAQLADVRERTRTLLARVEELERSYAQDRDRLTQAQTEVADAQNRYEQMAELLPEIEAVERYIEADATLVASLAAVEGHPVTADAAGLRATLERLRAGVREVDRSLSQAMQSHQQARETALRMLSHTEDSAD